VVCCHALGRRRSKGGVNVKALQLKALRGDGIVAVQWLNLQVESGPRHTIADENGALLGVFTERPLLRGMCRIRSGRLRPGSCVEAQGMRWRVEDVWASMAGQVAVGDGIVHVVASPARDVLKVV
jgi:hypothetical protein